MPVTQYERPVGSGRSGACCTWKQKFSTAILDFCLTYLVVFPILTASSGKFFPVGEREGLPTPEQRTTERGVKSGRNGTPVPQSRATLSASTRKYDLLTGSSAGIIVGCSGIATVPFVCVNSTTRHIAEYRDMECEVNFKLV